MTATEITAAACRAWAEDKEGKAKRKAPLPGFKAGFKAGATDHNKDTAWFSYAQTPQDLDVYYRFERGYAAGKAWREGKL